jgi:hypothetical protein
MTAKGLPTILAVDDDPDSVRNELKVGLGDRARGKTLHPQDVELHDLEEADLVLVDYIISNWTERSGVALSLQPANGLALAAVLREHVDRSPHDQLTAFALHSAHLDDIRGRFPGARKEPLIARLINLEWAFPKTAGARWEQMITLASSVRQLPRNWPAGDQGGAEAAALSLLGLPEDVAWFDRARRNVGACHPPIHDLSGGAHGLLFVRWVLHQVMPYPTFLWSEHWVAARLRMSVGSFQGILGEGGKLGTDLEAMEYKGVLAGFQGRRWWRGALEDYVWNLTSGRSLDVDSLHAALRERTKVAFEPLQADASIVCLGTDLEPTGEFISASGAVRLRPDQWPAFAEDAWTSVQLARSDASLRSSVDPIDEVQLVEGERND